MINPETKRMYDDLLDAFRSIEAAERENGERLDAVIERLNLILLLMVRRPPRSDVSDIGQIHSPDYVFTVGR